MPREHLISAHAQRRRGKYEPTWWIMLMQLLGLHLGNRLLPHSTLFYSNGVSHHLLLFVCLTCQMSPKHCSTKVPKAKLYSNTCMPNYYWYPELSQTNMNYWTKSDMKSAIKHNTTTWAHKTQGKTRELIKHNFKIPDPTYLTLPPLLSFQAPSNLIRASKHPTSSR